MTNWVHANLEFNGIPLLLGLDGTAVAGIELIGDVDIDVAGRILCVRLCAAKRGDPDLIIERGGLIWEAIFSSVAVGMSDEIDAATADPDETYESFVAEHALRSYEVV